MTGNRTLKLTHLCCTGWFITCVAFVVILALRDAGFDWWVIFSLTGHSAVVIVLALSVYLFSIFRGAVRSQEPAIEHPLSSAVAYMWLYSVSPVLGGLAGFLGMLGHPELREFLLGIAIGTLAVTFMVWIVMDPFVGIVEMLLPESRKHRKERLSNIRVAKEEQKRRRSQLLQELASEEHAELVRRQKLLSDDARQLAKLLKTVNSGTSQDDYLKRLAADIGVKAWQCGGIECMRQLHQMATAISEGNNNTVEYVDYIAIWWDGIGQWRKPTLVS